MIVLIDVLGPLRIRNPDPIPIQRPSHRRLLAILALAPGEVASIDALIERFWTSEPPSTPKATIQTHVSALRSVLGKDALRFERNGYVLDVDSQDVDANRLSSMWEAANAEFDRQNWQGVVDIADEAEQIWRGQPYPELVDDWFARAAIRRLEEMRLELVETRAAALLALNRAEAALPELEYMVIEQPGRERMWELLMTARYRLGRHSDAVRAFREASAHLAELGLEPSDRLRRLEEQILLHDRTLSPTPHNLPREIDTFVGRTTEISSIEGAMSRNRLVSLVGAAGSGKSRLALRVGAGMFDRHRSGVWFVTFESIDDPSLVLDEIARALGLKPRGEMVAEAVVDTLSEGTHLLILDNCEHLRVPVASVVESLLQRARELKILVTSREPLRVRGETLIKIRGLATAAEGRTRAPISEAAQLFIDRAVLADPALVLDDPTLEHVNRITRSLEGLPLALELAAARAASLGVETVAERLDDQLAVLARGAATSPDRHRSLQAAIEWSFRLLEEEERTALCLLSVFRGGFNLQAAEQLLSSYEIGALAVLPELVDKSLVEARPTDTGIRYRILEPVRQYGWAILDREGLLAEARDRHSRWVAEMAAHVWTEALGRGHAELRILLDEEADNLETALAWTRSSDQSTAAVIAEAIAWHWYLSGNLARAIAILDWLIDTTAEGERRALALALRAHCLAYSEDIDPATSSAEEAHSLLPAIDDPMRHLWILSSLQLCHLMSARSDPALMLRVADEASAVEIDSRDPYQSIRLEEIAADALCWNGRTEDGLSRQRAALALARSTDDISTIDRVYGHAIYNFMLDPQLRGTAPAELVAEWNTLIDPDDRPGPSIATDWLPWVYMQVGELEQAKTALEHIGDRRLEGYNRTIYLIVSSSLAWMSGDVNRAAHVLDELRRRGVSERWWHVFYPLAAEVAADRGDLTAARDLADEYLGLEVHDTGQAAKLGVLMPLVRAEVDVGGGERADAAERARGIIDRMRSILADTPPVARAWTSILTHDQNLLFARAELTRIVRPDPGVWAQAAGVADYEYYRLYAGWRRAEALLEIGDAQGGEALSRLYRSTDTAGTLGLRRGVVRTAIRHGIKLSTR